jgi:hypothetical protein
MKTGRPYLMIYVSVLLWATGTLCAQDTMSRAGSIQAGKSQDTNQIAEGESSLEDNSLLLSYAEKIQERFSKSPLLVTILYIVILYSISIMTTLLIIILLNRSKLEREKKHRDYLLEEYQALLMDYLFDEDKSHEAISDLRRVAHSQVNRQVLIDQMIDLAVNLKGEIKEKIRDLYFTLGLERDSMAKAYHQKWHMNVKGYRELAFMNIRDANEKIIKSLNSKNEILRMEAQIAMVRLSDGNPYEFLSLLKSPLSLWEQITLHELLIQHNLPVPDFTQWFVSENISVVKFSLEMVSWFKQKGVGKALIALFDHGDEEVRRTAYEVSGDLGLKMSLPSMVKKYEMESSANKLEILRTFSKVPQEKYLSFLKSVLDSEEDVQLQIEATKAMENTDEPGISQLIKLMKSKSEYKNYQIIIRHVLDGRIY